MMNVQYVQKPSEDLLKFSIDADDPAIKLEIIID